MRKANLHPNPLSGYSEDYPDPEDEADDLEPEPDALCADCGDEVFCSDRHFVEGYERFGAFLCACCFTDRCEDDGGEDE